MMIEHFSTKIMLFIFITLLTTVASNDPLGITNHDPEESMNASEVIRYHGYPVEEYDVTTKDGYILIIQRIPRGKNDSDTSKKRKPVFFQHGLLASSTCWLFDMPNKTLPFILADKGYDVWLGNYRGNSYGRRHETLNPEFPPFWLFSFQEMGHYDLPAMIDFVLDTTGFPYLHYIGHSMGTTGLLIMLSDKPEYNEKIRSFNALAPVGSLDYCKAPIIDLVAPVSDQLLPVTSLLGGYEFLPNSAVTELLAESVCKLSLTNELCNTVVFLFFGFDYEQFNQTRLPVYLHFFPDGTSSQTVQHYGQINKWKRFQHYDYGDPLKNEEVYGEIIPPLFQLEKITAPVALYYGDNDWLATPEDVVYIAQTIPNESLVLNYRVPFDLWDHGDFLWARDVNDLLYNKVCETLEKLWPDEE